MTKSPLGQLLAISGLASRIWRPAGSELTALGWLALARTFVLSISAAVDEDGAAMIVASQY